MADKIEEQNQVEEAKHQAEIDSSTMTMTEIETSQDEKKPSLLALKELVSTFSMWPPSRKTRDAVIERLIETLSTPSVLSKRYGTIPREEASEIAKRIEEEAFNAAGDSASGDGVDGNYGIEILQVYSKETSKRMLECVKSRSAAAPVPESVPPPQERDKLVAPPVYGVEIPAVNAEL